MPRSRPSEKALVRKGAWTHEEDLLLQKYIDKYGEGKWSLVPLRAGLRRCRKSCRLRWMNYLRPNIKRGDFEDDEIDLILRLHNLLGNKWSLIAGRIPGRTANDIKNYWNAHLKKRLLSNSTSSTKPHPPDDDEDDVHMLDNKNSNNKTRKRKKKKVEDVINTKVDNEVIIGKLPAASPSTTTTTVTLFKPQPRSLVCISRRSNQPSSHCGCKCHSGNHSPPRTASTSVSETPIDDEALWWESLLLVDDDVRSSGGGEPGVEMAAAAAAAAAAAGGSFEWKDLLENPSILWDDI